MFSRRQRPEIIFVLAFVLLLALSFLALQNSTQQIPAAQGAGAFPVYFPIVLNAPAPTPTFTPTPPTSDGFYMNSPNGMASDVARKHLFVSSRNSGKVIVWDELARTITKTISVGITPWDVAIANDRVFVGNFGSDSLSVIDAATLTKMPDIDLSSCGTQPAHIATSFVTQRVYVALVSGGDVGKGRVAVIDATNNILINCLVAGQGAFGVAVNPLPWVNQLYVTNRYANTLQVFDLSTDPENSIQTVPLTGNPLFAQADLSQSRVYLTMATNPPANDRVNALQIYDAVSGGVTFVQQIAIGDTEDGGAVWVSQARGGSLYIAATKANQLEVYESVNYTLFQSIPMSGPFAITQDVLLSRMYIGLRNTGWVSIQPDSLGAPIAARTPQPK